MAARPARAADRLRHTSRSHIWPTLTNWGETMNTRQTVIATAVAVALWGSYQVAVAADATAPEPTTPSPDADKPVSGTDSARPDQVPKSELDTIVITGVRESQERAIEVKRLAPSIQDSISAESIGQLPDTTITDALQRITGVQINRDAGVGTSVDVRGLPQVSTMLNGEVFITPDQIDSQQPDFTTLPATLFNQVDVIKSPPQPRPRAASAARSICTPIGPGICRTDSPTATPLTPNGEASQRKRGRRQTGSSHSTTTAAGVCRFPAITLTRRGRVRWAGLTRVETRPRASTSMASFSTARTPQARPATTASWGRGTARPFLPGSFRIQTVVSM